MAALGLVLASFIAFYVQQCTGRVVRSMVRSNSVDDDISYINLNDMGTHTVTSKRELESCSKDAMKNFNSAGSLKGLQWLEQEKDALPFTGEDGLFVDPAAKFAFCMIPKNGCSSWGTLFCRRVKGRDCGEGDNIYGVGADAFTSEGASQVFNDRTAIRAVFIRDPIERFLSAFLNKCSQILTRPNGEKYGNGNCPGNLAITKPSLKQVLEWVTERAGSYKDPHWTPQSEHCELKRRLHEFNVISDFSDFDNQAKCVLEMANISDWNRRDNGDEIIKGSVYPPSIGHSDRQMVLKKFFTAEAVRAVMSLYKADYELFKLPSPAWIHEVTGEWFEKPVPSGSERLYKLGHEDHADLDEDEDDIVKLSRRHGFLL